MAQPIVPTSAEEAAQTLAYAARLVRSVVSAQCREGLDAVVSEVRADFNQILFARAEAGGYDPRDSDALFSSAFAQTLVFGLLLARDAGSEAAGADAYEQLPDATYPLLRGTLRALTLEEVRTMLGAAFDVTVDAVNSVDPSLLTPLGERDPLLYLYEDFLRVFDPEAVRKYGVYYTPPEIVQLIVSEVDRTLRERFETEGLLDTSVSLLDPACGTGTFLIAAANKAAVRAESMYGRGAVAAEVAAFAQRMHGFELLVGPYTVAHYRMAREIAGRGGSSERLPIFLTDTLAPPADSAGLTPHLAFLSAPMVAEREAADSVKRDAPILVVMGNPPYKRLRAGEVPQLVGSDMDARWEDLKRPVREAGYGRSLNAFPDLYVAFYRWALWRLFEAEGAQGRGVLAFITNRNFLTGRGFGGLRKMLRDRFDFRGDRAAPARRSGRASGRCRRSARPLRSVSARHGWSATPPAGTWASRCRVAHSPARDIRAAWRCSPTSRSGSPACRNARGASRSAAIVSFTAGSARATGKHWMRACSASCWTRSPESRKPCICSTRPTPFSRRQPEPR